MLSPSPFLQPDQIAVPLACPKCGRQGLCVVEHNGDEYTLVLLPDGIYQRLAKAPPHGIETVCQGCDRVLPIRVFESQNLQESAERQVAEAEDRVNRQKRVVAQYKKNGGSVLGARTLLRLYEQALATSKEALELITRSRPPTAS
jgi:hypothetical protein